MQPRHHSSNRNGQCCSNFLVGHLLHVAEQDDLLVRIRDLPECTEDLFVGQMIGHRRDERERLAKPLFDRCAFNRCPIAGAAAIGAKVLQDRGQPGATIRARRKTVERLKCLRQRFLYEIFRLGSIALEPHRQTKKPVDVW